QQLVRRQSENLGNSGDGFLRLRAVFLDEFDIEGGTVADERLAIAIVNDAARRRNEHGTETIILALLTELRTVQNLEIPQAQHDDEKARAAYCQSDIDSPGDIDGRTVRSSDRHAN